MPPAFPGTANVVVTFRSVKWRRVRSTVLATPHFAAAPGYTFVKSMYQLVSQLLPERSGENACSQRAESSPVRDHR